VIHVLHSAVAKRTAFSSIILILGVFFIAANLRAPVTGIAPVLESIIASLSLSPSQAGMLTTLPLLAFALASPLANLLAKKLGLEVALFIALILIGAGLASRLITSVPLLYLGTAVIGIGIAIGNVLLPSLIKRDFPHKVAVMTSAYVLAMAIFGGGYAAIVFPLSEYQQVGWQIALASYGLLTLLSIFIWLPQLNYHTMPVKRFTEKQLQTNVWRQPLAWQITLLLGLNSFFTYIMVAWLPSMLIESGVSAAKAGAMQGAFQAASAVPGIVLIPLLARLKDQRLLSASLAMAGALCSFGLLFMPSLALFWSITLGFCSGACFILGLSFVSLRTHDSQQAGSLSAMAQCIGYLIAATGPMLAGALHTHFNSWDSTLWLCAIASLGCALFGYLGGRNMTIPKPPQDTSFS